MEVVQGRTRRLAPARLRRLVMGRRPGNWDRTDRPGPWRRLTWDAGGDDRFSVPPGFRVEVAARNPRPERALLSHQPRLRRSGAPARLAGGRTDPALHGARRRGACSSPSGRTASKSRAARGCAGSAMRSISSATVPREPGSTGCATPTEMIIRTSSNDSTSSPRSTSRANGRNGGMAEHGPHAVLHGPDGRVYLVVGNHAWARPDRLAANSPLTRWPDGQMGPDQGKPGTTEDVLLPRINESHAANILAPGGTVWRLEARRQDDGDGRRRVPQPVRRRLHPRRRTLHLRQRHGRGLRPSLVSPSTGLPCRTRGRLRLAHEFGEHAVRTTSTASRRRWRPAWARRPGSSVTTTMPSPRSIAVRSSWPTGRWA